MSSSDTDTVVRAARECLPISITREVKINGTDVETTVIVQKFSDRTFVVLTNHKRFGSILECSADISEIDQTVDYRVQPLLGKREDTVNEVYGRQLLEQIVRIDQLKDPLLATTKGIKPLLLSIALKDELRTPESFHQLLTSVKEIYSEIS